MFIDLLSDLLREREGEGGGGEVGFSLDNEHEPLL